MAFTPKTWHDLPSTTTPLTAAALQDLEVRVTSYADSLGGGGGAVSSVAGRTGAIVLAQADITNLTSDLSTLTTSVGTKLASSAVDTDATLAANSDARVASQKATKSYADTKVAGTLDTDGTLAANSDVKVASQRATKSYVGTQTALSVPLTAIDTDNTLTANSDARVASQKAIKAYVGTQTAAYTPLTAIDVDSTMAANSDTRVASQKATKTALATKPTATLDTDGTLTANSDTRVASQKATKAYVDASIQGLDVKLSVRVATTTNGTLASAYENGDTVDGVTLATGNRILIKNQTTGSENGIYTVNASGAPTRAIDANSSSEVTPGMFTFVEEGTANADTGWVMTNDGAVTLGTTALTFGQFSGAGTITAGNGLTKSGSTLSVLTDPTGGAGSESGLQLTGSGLKVNNGQVPFLDIANNFTGRQSFVSVTAPQAQVQSGNNTVLSQLYVQTSTKTLILGVAGATNDQVTGTASGDGAISVSSGQKLFLGQNGGAARMVLDGTTVDVKSQKVVNVTDPASAQDAATKAYVDAHSGASAPFINVKSSPYLAAGDGVTNDATAINNAITAAVGAGGGVVFFPPGTYLCNSSIAVKSNVWLLGSGQNATTIKKGTGFDLIQMNGTVSSTGHLSYSKISDMRLNGNAQTGRLIDAVYADNIIMRDLRLSNNNGPGVDCVEVWDSYIEDVICEDVNSITEPAFHIRSSRATSGFGSSNDSSNYIRMRGIRAESYKFAALIIEDGIGTPNAGPLGIWLSDFKFETRFMHGCPVVIQSNVGMHCRAIHFKNGFLQQQSFDTGYSTPQPGIKITGGMEGCSFRDLQVRNDVGFQTYTEGIYCNSSGGPIIFDGIGLVFDGGAPTSGKGLNLAGVFSGDDSYEIGMVYSGGAHPATTGVFQATDARSKGAGQIMAKFGTISDADWPTPPPIGTMALDVLHSRIYCKTNTATWQYSQLT